MAARCASCSYPLSVSDSVSCCECMSYFHIDCAQLVGFPYYELSADPVRNIFHCETCKILPLPRQSDFSDSDSDDCAMPSRQLEYHVEGHPDLASDMNEIKGTVQDLSDLCKDMFREINELKSINLTLRCCVENLRHDGEQQNEIISDLKRRIEALEGKRYVNIFKPIDKAIIYTDGISIEKEEDPERYLTPDPEYFNLKEADDEDQESFQNEESSPIDYTQNLNQVEGLPSESEDITEERIQEKSELPETIIDIPNTETSDIDEKSRHEINEGNEHFAEEGTISTTFEEDKIEESALVKDWDWKGNKAVQLHEEKNYSPEEDEGENKATNVEDTQVQDWEMLDEDVKSEVVTIHYEEVALETVRIFGGSDVELEEKRATWADEVEKDEDDKRSVKTKDVEEPMLKSESEYMTETGETRITSFEVPNFNWCMCFFAVFS